MLWGIRSRRAINETVEVLLPPGAPWIMGSLVDTFLQNPVGNPIANRPVLEYFPSFGPTQFAAGGAFGHAALWGELVLGLAWAAAFLVSGLIVFQRRTRVRRHP